jgi:hypothetical protein
MIFELGSLPRNCSNEEIIAEIKRVDALVGKDKLTIQDYDKFSKMSSSAVRRRFGGWKNTLTAAGIGHKYSGAMVSDKMRQQSKYLKDEEIIDELKRIAKELGQNFVTQENVNSHSNIISASTIIYRFGSWENGTKRAGLDNSPGYKGKFSDEEYFENLLNVWTRYGRQPKYDEMKESPSIISPKTYESHFGTWRKALEAFVERMNREDAQGEPVFKKEKPEQNIRSEIRERSVAVEDRRGVNSSLRYKVLSRDKFKCVRCGASPATDPTCNLHIDHIVPFSKGGKTAPENLQTLCKNCNLGKGNRHSE